MHSSHKRLFVFLRTFPLMLLSAISFIEPALARKDEITAEHCAALLKKIGDMVVFDYMTSDSVRTLTDHYVRALDLGAVIAKDPEFLDRLKNSEYPYWSELRRREIVLEHLYPYVEVTKPDLFKAGRPWESDRVDNNLMQSAMALATETGAKGWYDPDFEELFKMSGSERVTAIRKTFEKNRLELTTLHERQTGQTTFETYRLNSGSLDLRTYTDIKNYSPNREEMERARQVLKGLPSVFAKGLAEFDFGMAARIMRFAPEDKATHPLWIFTETFLIEAKPGRMR